MVCKGLWVLQALGSLFGKTAADGTKVIAVGTVALVLCVALPLGCFIQQAEPFSQCVRTVFSALGG